MRSDDWDCRVGLSVPPLCLIAVSIISADRLDTFSASGAACTVEQLRIRFEEFLRNRIRGREAAKARLIVVRGEQKAGES